MDGKNGKLVVDKEKLEEKAESIIEISENMGTYINEIRNLIEELRYENEGEFLEAFINGYDCLLNKAIRQNSAMNKVGNNLLQAVQDFTEIDKYTG